MKDYSAILDDIKKWCDKVGAFQLSHFRSRSLKVEIKSSVHDLVTEVDKKSEEMLINYIREAYPNTSILAEESGSAPQASDYLWVIDPLDGTNNFAAGLPVFAISIALQYRGTTQVGVVYAPYLRERYDAIKGQGAYCNGERITVSSRDSLPECILATGFPYDKATHRANNLSYLSNILPKIRGIRRFGAAAYDLCAVAGGFLDAYWELNLSPWDVAAGILIVEEAGGKVLHFRDDRKISIIAGNEKLVTKINNEHSHCKD